MKICKKQQSVQISNGEHCQITEFPLENDKLNMALVAVKGRYPESGFVTNRLVDEMVYITQGQGSLVKNDQQTLAFAAGDMVLVESGEVFYWEGSFTGVIGCSPAFTPDQHQGVPA